MKTFIIIILQIFSPTSWSPPIGIDRVKLAEALYYRSKLHPGIYGLYLAVQAYRLIFIGKNGLHKLSTSAENYVPLMRLTRMISLDEGFDKFDYDRPLENYIHPPFREDYSDILVGYLTNEKGVSYFDLVAAHHPELSEYELDIPDGTGFLISIDLEALVYSTREQILGLSSDEAPSLQTTELSVVSDARVDANYQALSPPDSTLHAVLSMSGNNVLRIDASRAGWRERFSEIFDPETGNHTDKNIRILVWQHFEERFRTSNVSDINLARQWAKAFYPASGARSHKVDPELFPELWQRYNPILGLSSVRLQNR